MTTPQFSRRSFIKLNSFAGLGIATLGVATMPASAEAALPTGVRGLGGLDLKELREVYSKALFDKFLPNMDQFVIDHELGGFMTNVDIVSRKQLSSNKRAWFEGRGIWTYSFLYNNFDKNPKYLDVARKSKDFILRLLPTDGTYYVNTFTKTGTPVTQGEGDIYGNLFVAEGLAEYSKASGEAKYLKQAKDIVLKAVDRYDRPEFTYPYKAEKVEPGPRILGHWMILLSVCTQMLRQVNDPQIQSLADRCVDAIMNHHMDNPGRVLTEARAHDLSPLTDPVASQFGDIGHGCETLAFVMNYAVLRKDQTLFNISANAFRRHVGIAKDNVYGGHFNALTNIDANTYAVTKSRWLQEEILIGAMILIEHASDPWALDCYRDTDTYIREKFARDDYAFVIDTGDRKMEKFPVNRAEHYHYPRQLMQGILAIDRMLAKK